MGTWELVPTKFSRNLSRRFPEFETLFWDNFCGTILRTILVLFLPTVNVVQADDCIAYGDTISGNWGVLLGQFFRDSFRDNFADNFMDHFRLKSWIFLTYCKCGASRGLLAYGDTISGNWGVLLGNQAADIAFWGLAHHCCAWSFFIGFYSSEALAVYQLYRRICPQPK